jgi:hypothetical protein
MISKHKDYKTLVAELLAAKEAERLAEVRTAAAMRKVEGDRIRAALQPLSTVLQQF